MRRIGGWLSILVALTAFGSVGWADVESDCRRQAEINYPRCLHEQADVDGCKARLKHAYHACMKIAAITAALPRTAVAYLPPAAGDTDSEPPLDLSDSVPAR